MGGQVHQPPHPLRVVLVPTVGGDPGQGASQLVLAARPPGIPRHSSEVGVNQRLGSAQLPNRPGFRLISRYAAALFDESGGADRSAYGRIAVDLLAVLVWQMANDGSAPVHPADIHLARLQRVARENIADPRLDVSLLASMAGVSVRTVYSAFAAIGLTPAEYIRRQRIEAAAARLSSSGVSVTDIAISVGFGDVTTFVRCFKRRHGVTPSQWRGAAR
jgi:AraC-like DNA-binding protein